MTLSHYVSEGFVDAETDHQTKPHENCPKRKDGKTNFPPFSLKNSTLLVLSGWFSASCANPGLFMLR